MPSRPERFAHLLAAALIALLAASPAALAQDDLVDGIAAQVGGDIVLISEVNQLAAPAESRIREGGGGEDDIAMVRAEILERLIERAILRQVVRKAELEASDQEVDEAIEAIAHENGISFDQLQQSVEAQGMPFDLYRDRIRAEIEQSKVVSGMVASQVRIDEDEVRALYQKEYADQPTGGAELHVRHLLVPFDPENPLSQGSACAKVRAAHARIASGEAFRQVASEVSVVNPGTGGDMGWIHDRDLAGWMRPALAPLEAGQFTDVIETSFGCNVLELVDRRTFVPKTYEEARESLRRELFGERMNEEYREFLEEMRERTFIDRKGIYADAARLRTQPAPDPGVGDF